MWSQHANTLCICIPREQFDTSKGWGYIMTALLSFYQMTSAFPFSLIYLEPEINSFVALAFAFALVDASSAPVPQSQEVQISSLYVQCSSSFCFQDFRLKSNFPFFSSPKFVLCTIFGRKCHDDLHYKEQQRIASFERLKTNEFRSFYYFFIFIISESNLRKMPCFYYWITL